MTHPHGVWRGVHSRLTRRFILHLTAILMALVLVGCSTPPTPDTAVDPLATDASDDAPSVSDFSDVPPGHKAEAAFKLLANMGIFLGYGDGTVGPDDPITREQFVTIVIRSVGRGSDAAFRARGASEFIDDADISPWARGHVILAHESGIVHGEPNGRFRPQEHVTFAEIFTMWIRAFALDRAATGPWPDNVLRLASALGLDAGLAVVPHAAVTRSEMAMAARAAILADYRVDSENQLVRSENEDGEYSAFTTSLGRSVDEWADEVASP